MRSGRWYGRRGRYGITIDASRDTLAMGWPAAVVLAVPRVLVVMPQLRNCANPQPCMGIGPGGVLPSLGAFISSIHALPHLCSLV
jgi:hypothetical protein